MGKYNNFIICKVFMEKQLSTKIICLLQQQKDYNYDEYFRLINTIVHSVWYISITVFFNTLQY